MSNDQEHGYKILSTTITPELVTYIFDPEFQETRVIVIFLVSVRAGV